MVCRTFEAGSLRLACGDLARSFCRRCGYWPTCFPQRPLSRAVMRHGLVSWDGACIGFRRYRDRDDALAEWLWRRSFGPGVHDSATRRCLECGHENLFGGLHCNAGERLPPSVRSGKGGRAYRPPDQTQQSTGVRNRMPASGIVMRARRSIPAVRADRCRQFQVDQRSSWP